MAYSTKLLLALAISALLACVVLAQPVQYASSNNLVKRESGVMDMNIENMPVKRKAKDDDDDNKNKKSDDEDDEDNDSSSTTTSAHATATSSDSSSKKTGSSKEKGIDNPDLIYNFNVKQKKTDCLNDGHTFLRKQNKSANKKKNKKDKKSKKDKNNKD